MPTSAIAKAEQQDPQLVAPERAEFDRDAFG